MVNSPNSAPEAPSGDSTSSFLSRMLHLERPSTTANSNGATSNVVELARRNETLNGAAREQTWLQRNVGDLFMTRTETRSELYTHGVNVNGDVEAAIGESAEVIELVTDDDKLRVANDNLEEHKEELRDAAEDAGEPTDDASIKERFDKEIDRFTNEENGRLVMKGRLDVVKDNWQRYKDDPEFSFWGFVKQSVKDLFFEYGAIRRLTPVLNAGRYVGEQVEGFKDEYGEYAENAVDGAKTVGGKLREKREAEKLGAAVLVKEGLMKFRNLASINGKQALLNIFHGLNGSRSPREYLMSQVDTTDIEKLARRYPNTFAAEAKNYGIKAVRIKGAMAVAGLTASLFDWYVSPSNRRHETKWEMVKDYGRSMIPFEYVVNGTGDYDHLPFYLKYPILAATVALDTATVIGAGAAIVGTGGIAAPAVAVGGAAVRSTARKGLIGLATRLSGTQARRRAIQAARPRTVTAASATNFAKNLPKEAYNALFKTTSGRLLTGYAGLSALSAMADYVIGNTLNEFVVDTTVDTVQRAYEENFSEEQRRLIALVDEESELLDSELLARLEEDPEDAEETLVAANDNTSPSGLTDGQIAEVSAADQERKAA